MELVQCGQWLVGFVVLALLLEAITLSIPSTDRLAWLRALTALVAEVWPRGSVLAWMGRPAKVKSDDQGQPRSAASPNTGD